MPRNHRFKNVKNNVRSFVREQRCTLLALRSFVDPNLCQRDGVHWLFVLTFPNGGSTALAKLLMSASASRELTPNAEGQWLIPSLSAKGRRWDSSHEVWQRKLRACWLNELDLMESEPIVVIEKSPPNLCRYNYLLSAFSEMKHSLITFTRDPYAVCASWHKRYGAEGIIRDWYPGSGLKINSEGDYVRFLGEIWLERARMILAARKDSVLDLNYETFTGDVNGQVDTLRSLIPELHDMSHDAHVKVKDYESQPIRNMNEEQIKLFSVEQIDLLSSVFSEHANVLEELGYAIR